MFYRLLTKISCPVIPSGDMLEQLVSHPEYKLLSLRNIPQMSQNALQYSTYRWPGLLKHLRQMLVADAPLEEGIMISTLHRC